MTVFIDEQRSTYYEQKVRQADPGRVPARARGDEVMREQIERMRRQNHDVYGPRKVWRQLKREKISVARCKVERLMRAKGRQGVVRARKSKTTTPDDAAVRPADLVRGDFTTTRPNQFWVADLTYVVAWHGFVYEAFGVDVFAHRILGWRASNSLRTDLALEALDLTLYDRPHTDDLAHHSDRGTQYLSIRYTERLAEAGVERSVESVGDSYDNARAESIIGLYKTEVIRQRGPWRNIEQVEFETLTSVDWFNNRRLLEPIGYIPPAEIKQMYYRSQATPAAAAGLM